MAQQKKNDIVTLPIDLLIDHPDNPNVMNDGQFNKLAENIDEIGFAEPIQVAKNKDGTYTIIGGHHRVKAAKLHDYTELPAIVMEELEEGQDEWQDKRLHHLVRFNIIRGKIDPLKFTQMFDQLSEKYGREALKDAFGFWDERSFSELYKSVKAELPPELQEKLEDAKQEIKTIEDLARILNKLFTEHGEELDYGYMWFAYGGKDHFYVRMTTDLLKDLKQIEARLKDEGKNVNELLIPIIDSGWKQYQTDNAEA